jgi:hypothetical protein
VVAVALADALSLAHPDDQQKRRNCCRNKCCNRIHLSTFLNIILKYLVAGRPATKFLKYFAAGIPANVGASNSKRCNGYGHHILGISTDSRRYNEGQRLPKWLTVQNQAGPIIPGSNKGFREPMTCKFDSSTSLRLAIEQLKDGK